MTFEKVICMDKMATYKSQTLTEIYSEYQVTKLNFKKLMISGEKHIEE